MGGFITPILFIHFFSKLFYVRTAAKGEFPMANKKNRADYFCGGIKWGGGEGWFLFVFMSLSIV